ncbi:uncharacterized protein LOC121825292 [Peromyscus maniculatus bairdii]|uniref:uncharacterized protein LOC121825292 n=1 Tax=Peromyscus maniculatus bairdii TaxID=230844 RepID=UPI003FD4AF8E
MAWTFLGTRNPGSIWDTCLSPGFRCPDLQCEVPDATDPPLLFSTRCQCWTRPALKAASITPKRLRMDSGDRERQALHMGCAQRIRMEQVNVPRERSKEDSDSAAGCGWQGCIQEETQLDSPCTW